jgi:hypothetical protein
VTTSPPIRPVASGPEGPAITCSSFDSKNSRSRRRDDPCRQAQRRASPLPRYRRGSRQEDRQRCHPARAGGSHTDGWVDAWLRAASTWSRSSTPSRNDQDSSMPRCLIRASIWANTVPHGC